MSNPNGGSRSGLYPTKSRKELSDITGINRSVISGILNGTRGCTGDNMVVLSQAIGISLQSFIRDLKLIRRN